MPFCPAAAHVVLNAPLPNVKVPFVLTVIVPAAAAVLLRNMPDAYSGVFCVRVGCNEAGIPLAVKSVCALVPVPTGNTNVTWLPFRDQTAVPVVIVVAPAFSR